MHKVHKSICRTRFWWDLVAWIPWDYIVLLVLGDFHAGDSIVARVPILRLFRLVRILTLYNSLLGTTRSCFIGARSVTVHHKPQPSHLRSTVATL